IGSQFHPEFKSRPLRPAPLFHGFIGACAELKEPGTGREAIPTGERADH
ncbi:MAG: hypothetical protein H0X57_16955, partial [Rubrobacter sp.]|nr:hypothetical protein [Rubrobacter sp.]